MQKLIMQKFFAVMLAAGLACLFSSHALAQDPVTKWRFGTLAPKGVGYSSHVTDIIFPAVIQACGGNLNVKIFWGGVLGDDEQHIAYMEQDKLDGAGMSGQGTFLACPEAAVLGLPFLFQDYSEVDYVKSRMIAVFDRLLEKKGLRMLAWLDQDFDQIYSVHKPLKTLEDFAGVPFAVWFAPLEDPICRGLGARALPTGVSELAESIRQERAEAVTAPAIWVVGSQLYTTLRHVNTAAMRYSPAFAVVTSRAWNALPPDYSRRIEEIRLDVGARFNEKARAESRKCLEAILQYGLEESVPSPEELSAIRARVQPVWRELSGTLFPEKLLAEIQEALERRRAGGESKP